MADKEVLFAIKQQIMSVDDLIKEREDQKIQQAAKEAMKIQLAEKEVSDKESQTDLVPTLVPKVPKLRNFGTQTEEVRWKKRRFKYLLKKFDKNETIYLRILFLLDHGWASVGWPAGWSHFKYSKLFENQGTD